jgi:nucleoside-diphosphate-sugar epimerase
MFTFKKAAILGATGPIGISLARTLRENGLPVRVVSRSETNLKRLFADTVEECAAADMSQANDSRRAVEGCDLVFNCIGLPGDRMHQHPVTARNIAAAIERTGARCLHISSYWAYLPAVQLPLNEQHPRAGGSQWVQYRRAAEDILQQAGSAIINLPDFYGPHVHTSALQQALTDAVRGQPMSWIGAADTVHEYVFVLDAAHMAATLASYRDAYGQRWIFPGAGAITGRQVADIVSRLLHARTRLRTAGITLLRIISLFNPALRGFLQMVPEYVKPITYDAMKLEGLIGRQPVTRYDEGIAQTLEWLQRAGTA